MAPFETAKRFQTTRTSPSERRERGFEREYFGMRIWDLDPQGPLGRAGFRLGDVITKINGNPIPSDEKEQRDFFDRHINTSGEMVSIAAQDGETTTKRWVNPVLEPSEQLFVLRFDWMPCRLRVQGEGTREETWTERQRHVYRDEQGDIYACVDIELDAELKELGKEERLCQRVLQCRVASNETDEMVDLLPEINPEQIPIFLDFASLENLASEKWILVADFASPESIGSLIHEIRHVRQWKDPFFGALLGEYGAESDPYTRKERPFKRIAKILKLFPHHQEALLSVTNDIRREDERSHLAWVQDRRRLCSDAESRSTKMRGWLSFLLEKMEQTFNGIRLQPFPSKEEEEQRAEEELSLRDVFANDLATHAPSKKTEILAAWDRYVFGQHAIEKRMREEGVMNILRWPCRVVERDAEAVHLHELRNIREEYGINLLKSYLATEKQAHIAEADAWREDSPQNELRKKLREKQREEFSRMRDEMTVDVIKKTNQFGRQIASADSSVQNYMRELGASPRNMRIPRYEKGIREQQVGRMISQSNALRERGNHEKSDPQEAMPRWKKKGS